MKKSILMFLLLCGITCIAQEPPQRTLRNSSGEKWTDRIYLGGNIGLQFGSQTAVEIAPVVGYRITEEFSAGIGGKYIYYKLTDPILTEPFETNIYGGSVFAKYLVLENVFLYSEYEVLNMEVFEPPYYNKIIRENIPALFVGAGYRQMLGDNSFLDLMLLYNVIDDHRSIYDNPLIRMGFGIGL
jgi:hypothetical protein